MTDFFNNIISLIQTVLSAITDTAKNIDSITFDNTAFSDWLGYARYVMGDPLYMLFTTCVLIVIGISIWSFLLKGIHFLRALLP